MRKDYKAWLERQKYDAGTISAQLHRVGRVEEHYGDADANYASDRLESVIAALQYGKEDERYNRPNPSRIPFKGNVRTNLASYKNAIQLYVRFLADERVADDQEALTLAPASPTKTTVVVSEDSLGQRFGLERDMQAWLRQSIEHLAENLVVIDDGVERSVESGFIDITAKDADGAIVIIELKTGIAGQRAVAQLLSYMGDIAAEEPDAVVRGILIASDFDGKARAAARMVPALSLHRYGVRFQFSKAD